ncbi:MAG: hypothetical protein V2I97_15475 [Desulfococcaceae bacterium]|jgi:hypothetical protein|nr:hypothetical protein [Desulfococcaceae bacterium]
MKMKFYLILIIAIVFSANPAAAGEKKWWEKWDAFPKDNKAPRIMPEKVKDLIMAGEKVLFVYAGYDVDTVLCGSLYLPYTLVPPRSDGSRVNLKVLPKDWWIMCY